MCLNNENKSTSSDSKPIMLGEIDLSDIKNIDEYRSKLRSPKDVMIKGDIPLDEILTTYIKLIGFYDFDNEKPINKIVELYYGLLLGENLSYIDFSDYDLRYMNFSNLHMEGSLFINTILHKVNLSSTNLQFCIFNNCNLSNSNLKGTKLYSTYFTRCDLSYSIIEYSDLSHGSLESCDLTYSNIIKSDFSYSYLNYSNILYRTKIIDCEFKNSSGIDSANLKDADLRGVKNMPYIPMVCPEEGSFIGWKIAEYKPDNKSVLVKLEIPEDAKRSSATSRKCRCNKAKVLGIYELDGKESDLKEVVSRYDKNFIYKIGETVEVEDFCEDRWYECSSGIHFFMNKQEAIDYHTL